MPAPGALRAIAAYWAADLGCELERLQQAGTPVVPQASPAGYRAAFAFRRDAACVVAVPPPWLTRVTSALGGRTADEVFDAGVLTGLFAGHVDRVVGPAWLGYTDRADFRPVGAAGVRLLAEADEPALRRLAAACGEVDWEHSDLDFQRAPVAGRFEGGEIVAAAGYAVRGEVLAHVGFVTHPAHRGRGHGAAVAGRIVGHALGQGLIAQWQTLAANTPSMLVAARLGFRAYAATIAVRLITGDP